MRAVTAVWLHDGNEEKRRKKRQSEGEEKQHQFRARVENFKKVDIIPLAR